MTGTFITAADGIELGSVANWVAASIAAMSAAIVLWVRWRDRKQAEWIVTPLDWNPNTPAGVFEVEFEAINVGDGDAHQVRLVGHGCEAEFRVSVAGEEGYEGRWISPLVRPSSTVRIYAHMPMRDKGWMDRRASTVVELQWLATPTRHRRVHRAYVDFFALQFQDRDSQMGAGLPLHEPFIARWFCTPEYRSERRAALLRRDGHRAKHFSGSW